MNEVKRQAMSELQKAVSDAERKAHELITTERAKMERALAEAKRQASEDALTVINQQEDSSEVRAGRGKLGGDVVLLQSGFAASLHVSVGTGGLQLHHGVRRMVQAKDVCSRMMCMVWDVDAWSRMSMHRTG